MSDLSKYDEVIVEAAEKWVDSKGLSYTGLAEAVEAKRESFQPKPCSICPEVATNAIVWPRENRRTHYCDFHRPEVVEL